MAMRHSGYSGAREGGGERRRKEGRTEMDNEMQNSSAANEVRQTNDLHMIVLREAM